MKKRRKILRLYDSMKTTSDAGGFYHARFKRA